MIEISLRASGVVTASQIRTLARLNLRPVLEKGMKNSRFQIPGAKFPDAI
jgi:hypothetical protein